MTGEPRAIVVTSASGDVLGFVHIDTLVNGRARGGMRLMPDVTPHELELLARAMTLKYGFLGLPQGGAKAGVIGDPESPPDERAVILRCFAERAARLLASREYVPDSDMGTTGGEIQRMLEGIGVRVARREYRGDRSGLYTAATVFESARAAAAAQGLPFAGCRVAVEGFGRVGQPLVEKFARAGAKIVAVSTRRGGVHNAGGLDVEALREHARAGGDAAVAAAGLGERIAAHDVTRVPADILCPCARHESILDGDAVSPEVKVISCGANSPLTPGAERRVWERGIVCVPDFVANAGGVLGGTMEFAGWRTGEILDFCERRYSQRVASLIREARLANRPLREIAEVLARGRFDEVKRRAERRSPRRAAVEAALHAYREGWVPVRLVKRVSVGYFSRCVG
jgi:glutamate dehydrogenase (NAD(P)+)